MKKKFHVLVILLVISISGCMAAAYLGGQAIGTVAGGVLGNLGQSVYQDQIKIKNEKVEKDSLTTLKIKGDIMFDAAPLGTKAKYVELPLSYYPLRFDLIDKGGKKLIDVQVQNIDFDDEKVTLQAFPVNQLIPFTAVVEIPDIVWEEAELIEYKGLVR